MIEYPFLSAGCVEFRAHFACFVRKSCFSCPAKNFLIEALKNVLGLRNEGGRHDVAQV